MTQPTTNVRAYQWEAEWEAKFLPRWRSLAKSFGGSHLYEPVEPLATITLETNESRIAILALERDLNGKQLSEEDPTSRTGYRGPKETP